MIWCPVEKIDASMLSRVEPGYVKHGRGAWAAQGVLQMFFQRPNRAELGPMETNGGEG